jgi:hypothetical protein
MYIDANDEKEGFLILSILPDFNEIWQDPFVNGLGSVRHVAFAFEVCLFQKPWQRTAMIQMKTEWK